MSQGSELIGLTSDDSRQWRIDRNIVVALGTFLFIQTSGAIWWAATISRDVSNVQQTAIQIKADAYTRVEASLQVQNRDIRLDSMTLRIIDSESRVRELEKFINRVVPK